MGNAQKNSETVTIGKQHYFTVQHSQRIGSRYTEFYKVSPVNTIYGFASNDKTSDKETAENAKIMFPENSKFEFGVWDFATGALLFCDDDRYPIRMIQNVDQSLVIVEFSTNEDEFPAFKEYFGLIEHKAQKPKSSDDGINAPPGYAAGF